MFILTYILKWIVQQKEEVSIGKVHLNQSLKLPKGKKIKQTEKIPQNYQAKQHDSFVFEQKPVEIDVFNDDKEKEVKERVKKKRKKKGEEVAEKNKPLKRQKKNQQKNKTRQNYGLS